MRSQTHRRRLSHPSITMVVGLVALTSAVGVARAQTLGDIFYIEMENHNFTQPAGQSSPQALKNNPAAPYQNSLITPGNPNAAQTSWASSYHNVGAGVHPSEPNYIWQEAGTNFGVLNDNQPYGAGGNNQNTTQHLTGLMQAAGISWKSYQEDTNLTLDGNGKLTSTVLPQSQWTVPLTNKSGTNAAYTNAYNGSNQYDFAAKHDGTLFFTDTNGGNNATTTNPEISHYAPLQQLQTDLNNNTVARYNLITPDQFNDSHTALSAGFTYNGVHYTGDAAAIAQGDNFLATIVPIIQASQAYQNNGAIVIWWDETEGGDDFDRTLEEIVLSPLAKGNAYESALNYTHSSDLKTLEELYGVYGANGGFLADANNPATNDFRDLFVAGAVVPEPSQAIALGLGVLGVARMLRKSRKRRSAA